MKKIALIRGKFLTKYDMEPFEMLSKKYNITAFGSKTPFSEDFKFPTVKLWSPVDIPNFPYKMQLLNRIFIDAHLLIGLEEKLSGFDLAHTSETYFHYTHQALNAKKNGIIKKVVCSVFENIPFNNEGIWGRNRYKKEAIEGVDRFIAITKGAKKALVGEGVPEEKIVIIPMSIDSEKFYPSKKIDKHHINILFAGRIEEYKGVFDALNAFARVSAKYSNIRLTIIGKGSKESLLDNKINELGLSSKIIRKVSPYHQIAEEYRKVDIFIAPSKKDKYWKEQFGMVFLEAMASGLPIVTYDSGSIKEVVGSSALVVKEGDATQLYKNLELLVKSGVLRAELGKNARERALSDFNVHKISQMIDRVYRDLL